MHLWDLSGPGQEQEDGHQIDGSVRGWVWVKAKYKGSKNKKRS